MKITNSQALLLLYICCCKHWHMSMHTHHPARDTSYNYNECHLPTLTYSANHSAPQFELQALHIEILLSHSVL